MMDRRNLLIVALILLPIGTCVGFGAYAIWVTGYWKSLWWIFPGCWVAAWLTARLWKRHDLVRDVARATGSKDQSRTHWDRRDREAAAIIDRYQRAMESVDSAKLTDPHHYLSQAQALAVDLAKFYRDGSGGSSASAAIESLTIVEIAAAARLAIDDLESWILTSVPGSRMVTISQWRKITSAPKWYAQASKVYWAASTLINPTNLIRYATSKAMLDPVVGQLQTEVVATFYLNFLRRVGFYLIEMNSGRLRGGAAAYSQAFAERSLIRQSHASKHDQDRTADPPSFPSLQITLIGQTGSGKSSLVNALIGRSVARTDVLPETRAVTRHQCDLGGGVGQSTTVTLLDTAGYEQANATKQQMTETFQAAAGADMVLLVIDGHLSARQCDVAVLHRLDEHFRDRPKSRRPPILVVMTHVDQIPPASLWQPPYDLESPVEAKEENIRGARDYADEIFGSHVAGVACVCLSNTPEAGWGVAEDLVPRMLSLLDDGRQVSLIRVFERQVDSRQLRTLLTQVKNLASDGWKAWVKSRL